MRFLFGFVGFFAGAILGIVASFLLCNLLSQGNTLAFGFAMILGAPVGVLAGGVPGIFLGLRLQQYLMKPDPDGRERNARLCVIASLLICYPATIAALNAEINRSDAPPTDRVLIADFTRHQTQLDQIVTMLHQDRGLKRVGDNWTDPENPVTIGVTARRIADYRSLLRTIGATDGLLVRDRPSQIEFMCWGRGSAVSSDHFKGYAYLPSLPNSETVVDDLDADSSTRSFCRYRHLVGNWYLYRMFIPE